MKTQQYMFDALDNEKEHLSDMAMMADPTPEKIKRWSRAVNNTYQVIGADANLEGEKPWVIVQCCLDADHCRFNGGLTKEDYDRFQAWYRDVMKEYGYEKALKRLAKILGITG
jgi:hypothetical protein